MPKRTQEATACAGTELPARALRSALAEMGDEVLNDQGIPLQLPAYASAELKVSFIELLKQEVLRLQASA